MKSFPTGISPRITWLVAALMFTASVVAQAQPANLAQLAKPNWNRAVALRAAAYPPDSTALSRWLQQIENVAVTALHQELENSDQAGSPAFEAQLHKLAIALAEAPLDDSADDLLAWLANYPSQVLVAHEESAAYGVPLFPIAAAAKGSQLERQRRMAQRHAEEWAEEWAATDPSQWTQHYLAASAIQRQGFIQSLSGASADALLALADQLQAQIPAQPELAAPAGVVASRLSAAQLFLAAYAYSSGADSAALLREAGWRLNAAQRAQMFAGVMELPAADKTALGISMLAPGLQSNPNVSSMLLTLLDDPELGAAAALALAGHPDPKIQASLQRMLQAGGLKGRRAALALDENGPNHATVIEP
ncbi:MAG: hypothetical protein SH820_10010 [Xanthomonadales bacterium]|nr:hypothetical protein [Xanthomonadales bacterium]